MAKTSESELSDAELLAKLVSTALAQTELAGLSAMIGVIAQAVDAPIAILWQVAPEPVKDTLFILAEWFDTPQDQRSYFHTLEKSTAPTTFRALETGKPQPREPIDPKDYEFFADLNIKGLVSIPITDTKNVKEQYALNLYWKTPSPLSPEDNHRHIDKASFLASQLLDLYNALVDKVSYSLVSSCNQSLNKLNTKEIGHQAVAKEVCENISSILQAHEVTFYLSEKSHDNKHFQLQATTWQPSDVKPYYETGSKQTLTGWVLTEQQHLKIFDLALYGNHKAEYAQLYPGLDLEENSFNRVSRHLREKLNIPPGKSLPPLSLIAIPIMYSSQLLGAIRCFAATKPPYYFSDHQKQLLTLVADQIAQAWDGWLNRRNIELEQAVQNNFVEKLAKLNDQILQTLNTKQPLSKDAFLEELRGEIIKKALSNIHQSLGNVEISSIRLIKTDETGREYLYFAQLYGTVDKPDDRFYLDELDEKGKPEKLAVWVVKNKRTYVLNDKDDPYYHASRRFKAESMIISPIKSLDEVIGVIDVRNQSSNVFAPSTVAMIELIGLQLGIYSHLFETTAQLRESVASLNEEKQKQTQSYENFAHQLKAPVTQVKSRISSIIDEYRDIDTVPKQWWYLRGLSSKVLRVSQSIRLFVELTKNSSIALQSNEISELSEDWLRKTLWECSKDQENTIDPTRKILFKVRPDNGTLNRAKVLVERGLFILAVNNLLDNAAKYSFDNTTVEVRYGLSSSRKNFYISIINTGFSIEEPEKCKERYWRGNNAREVTGEGSGIGLWVVDHIMKAHNGVLEIMATNKHQTEVRLLFPAMLRY